SYGRAGDGLSAVQPDPCAELEHQAARPADPAVPRQAHLSDRQVRSGSAPAAAFPGHRHSGRQVRPVRLAGTKNAYIARCRALRREFPRNLLYRGSAVAGGPSAAVADWRSRYGTSCRERRGHIAADWMRDGADMDRNRKPPATKLIVRAQGATWVTGGVRCLTSSGPRSRRTFGSR